MSIIKQAKKTGPVPKSIKTLFYVKIISLLEGFYEK
jgi:hypothetical protein